MRNQESPGLCHFGTFCREKPELEYDDGAETVFVNAKGNREGLDAQAAGLLEYISEREVRSVHRPAGPESV